MHHPTPLPTSEKQILEDYAPEGERRQFLRRLLPSLQPRNLLLRKRPFLLGRNPGKKNKPGGKGGDIASISQ
jgi:hypothetical protein